MALPHLIKHIYNNGTDEVIRRGKKIHLLNYVELSDHDDLMSSANFRVKDDMYNSYYKVVVQNYNNAQSLNLRCSCPYNLTEICRHEVAALFKLQDLLDKRLIGNEDAKYNQQHTVVKMKSIDLKFIRVLADKKDYEAAENFLSSRRAEILSAEDEKVIAEITFEGIKQHLVIQKNEEKYFDTSCTCVYEEHPLCVHKLILFIQLFREEGSYFFDTIRNWDKEKSKLLELYGFSLEDDLEGKFEFNYKEGKPFLKVLDNSIKRVSPSSKPPAKVISENIETETLPVEAARKKLGIVFNMNEKNFPGFNVAAIKSDADDAGGKVEVLDLSKYVNTEIFSEEDKALFQNIRKLQDNEINKYLNRNSPFSGIWENIIHTNGEELPDETKALIGEYILPKLIKLFAENSSNKNVFMLPAGRQFKTQNLVSLKLSEIPAIPVFKVVLNGDAFELQTEVEIENNTISVNDNEGNSDLFFVYNDTAYLWKTTEDCLLMEKFRKGKIQRINADKWGDFMEKEILPLSEKYKVDFDKSLLKETKTFVPEIKLMLQEKGHYLIFRPVFVYNGFPVKNDDKPSLIIPDGNKILVIERNRSIENDFLKKLESLHSSFTFQPDGSLALRGTEVLKNNWFFLFIDTLKEMKIPVYGFETLKNYRFNTARPNTQIHVSSGMDWFDAKIEIDFGGQKIGIAEIKRALASKQSFVQLSDGSLGILPEDWIKKYSLLFKVGEGNKDKLKLSKYHLSVIDELYATRNEEELTFALDEKYERLKLFSKIPDTLPPSKLEPVLRPYQREGFQWLNYLNEVGWGGILADDMGLGKTVQALSMLQHYKTNNGSLKALVVCPTTLIYNWQNEVKKFTPDLSYHIHHGNNRTRSIDILQSHNILITTYGTLRSDINLMIKIDFDYVILDESQAIKNPSSKVTKAATLLNARNKICMSGTPLQNNTFDIFAQMNFLNPGLLGSVEFFRNEFAQPIDKFGEPEQKEHLKKLLVPFILRRTKEQVAKDLPEKTETILFCEMDNEQRRIYDAYRNSYRDKIMGTINDLGIDKSQLTILQGLMKLRQICDSPAILNEEEKFPNVSIKLEELVRELSENISNHKALVFSQFLGMLGLIRKKLDELGIKYEYFDGSTSTADREKAIQSFQNDEEVRVFLISLKAGGVGLNLTAADYVYIVDPWWNPAVEQQAIDRTHRIGQTKNIFAYRMICVDTIEDKILQLQEKKRLLAKDLIGDDSNFVKTLTKADVEYLFS